MATVNDIKEAVDGMNERHADFIKSAQKEIDHIDAENKALKDRIEELESHASRLGRTAAGPGGKPLDYKVHQIDGTKVYELPANVKMGDVAELRPAKAPEISLDRWLAAAMLGEKCRDREAVEYARELKSLTGGTTGVQLPEQFVSQWIDNLRARMVLNAAGMTTVTMAERTQTHSRVTGDPTVSWRSEAGSISASDPVFELRQLTAKSVVTRVQGSVELAADSPDFGQQLMAVMSRALAVEIDRAGVRGSGASNEPTGVINVTGVNSVSGGTLTNYDPFVDAIGELWDANVQEDRVGAILVSPTTARQLRKLKTGLTGDETTLVPPPGLPRFLVSSTLDDNSSPATSTSVVGDWPDLLLGVRREASVETLRLQSYADNLLLEFLAWARVDFLVRRPASFTKITGITN